MSAIAAWFVYGVVVSALLGLAALAAESSVRALGRPARWVWFGAMTLAVIVPVIAYLVPNVGSGGGGAPVPGVPVLTLPAVAVAEPAVEGGSSAGVVLLAVWVLASAVLAGVLLRSASKVQAQRWRWQRTDLYGSRVWLTDDLGPAVFGWRAPAILLPRWVLALDRRAQELLMLHEREHVRAGDPQLLLAAAALVVLVPWNLALWWMLSRLRLAVEIDCDSRVMARVPDTRAYGGVLLEAGRRLSGVPTLVAFAEPRRLLERRIRSLTAKPYAHPVARGLAFGLLGATSVVLAMCARDPVAGPDPLETAAVESDADVRSAVESLRQDVVPSGDEAAEQDDPAALQDSILAQGPTFTPMTVAPQLANQAEVQTALTNNYPPVLRDAGIGGRVTVWFLIDETGRVVKTQLNESSGHQELNMAALRVANEMRFTPAYNRGEPVSVWVSIPIAFENR